MSIEALLERVALGLERVADNQDRLIAGQAAAIEKIEAPKTKRETAAEKKAREAAEAAAAASETAADAGKVTEVASTASQATDAGAAANDAELPTEEQFKLTATTWAGKAVDEADKKARAAWLQTMARHLVGETDATKMVFLTGPDSKLTGEDRKKGVFFIKRAHKLGDTKHVDFAAPYDFDETPDQDAPRVETAEAPAADFDPLG